MSWGGALLMVLTMTLAACSWGNDTTANGIVKAGDNTLRTDLEPLVERLPRLADVPGAEWMGGTLGDRLSVGLTTYWMDAVVVLDEATLQEVSDLPGLAVADPPGVVRSLKSSLPEGELMRSEALDEYFTAAPWRVEAWLSRDERRVVLLVTGGPN